MHPTVKPVALIADALKDCSRRGDLVLDPFGGSGTTLIAAQETGRVARLIEFDPLYCDAIVRRFERFTGKEATLATTGVPLRALPPSGSEESGKPVSVILLHPDDIEFDCHNLEVEITGPCNEIELVAYERARRFSKLCVEMSLYLGEENRQDAGDRRQFRVGVVVLCPSMPGSRAAAPHESMVGGGAFERRMGLDHRRWASYLKQECEAVGIPFDRARKTSWPVYPLDELEDLPGFRKA